MSVGLAFLAGLLSFLSPCVFPLVPVYAGYLSGRVVAEPGGGAATADAAHPAPRRSAALSNGLAFVVGFSIVFVVLYYVFSALAVSVFTAHRNAFNIVGGAITIVFALQMLGVLRIPALTREFRALRRSPLPGLAGSFLLGVGFAAAWSPCLGPQLGAILTLAQNGNFGGLPFMLLYCAGLAVPFLAVAALAQRARGALRAINAHMNLVSLVSGSLLLAFGILLITGRITLLSTIAPGSPFDI